MRFSYPCSAAGPQAVSRARAGSACARGACREFEFTDSAVRDPNFLPQRGNDVYLSLFRDLGV